jgi:hypothetical protein
VVAAVTVMTLPEQAAAVVALVIKITDPLRPVLPTRLWLGMAEKTLLVETVATVLS